MHFSEVALQGLHCTTCQGESGTEYKQKYTKIKVYEG